MGLLQLLTRYVDGTPTSQVTLGLALLTLSWDKNWDSHSLVNGYPSFYPRIALVAPSPGWSPSGIIRPPTMITLINIMVMNGWLTSFLFHVNRTFHSWDKAIADSGCHGCDQRANHIVSPVSYWLASFSFHINQTNNSWDTAISKFDLEISKVKIMSEAKRSRSYIVPSIQPMHFFFFSHQLDNHSWDMAKTVLTLKKHIRNLKKKIAKITIFGIFFSKI